MISRTFKRAAAAAGASVFVVLAGGGAAAVAQGADQPQAKAGHVIDRGADGAPRTLMCPAEESVMSGGYVLSAPHGRVLGDTPADLVESRPTADATGWTVAVRKDLADGRSAAHRTPANLTLYVVCTQGENTPGG